MFSNRDLKKLIVPLIIEQILAITVGMVDTMMVSVVGEAAVSGVSLVDMINQLIINIFAALATGGAVVTAQYIGKKDNKRSCESAGQLMIVAFFISVAAMVLCLVIKKSLLRLAFGSIDDDVMQSALIYFMISAVSYPFISLYNSGAALFRAMGNSKVSMQVSILMNLINIVGDALLIFVFNWGVAGAAIASLISRAVAALIIQIMLYNPKHIVHIEIKEKFHFNMDMIKKILNIGIPNSLENSLFQLGRILVVSLISMFGTIQIAANAVANNIDAMGCIPGQAMSLAMITVVGQCVGAGDYNQATTYAKKILKWTYIITISLNSVILVSLPLVLNIYSLSAETIKLATILIIIHDGCAMLLWPASFTLPNALRAANDVKFTMIISIFSMWTFRIGLSYIIARHFNLGAIGVWIAMVADWIFRALCFIARFKSGKWKTYKI